MKAAQNNRRSLYREKEMNNTGCQKGTKYNIKKGIIHATVQVVLDEASSL